MGDDSLRTEQLTVLLFGVGVAAVVVTLYHCFAACWCHRHRSRNAATTPPVTELFESPTSFENSVAQLIPAHKYLKGTSSVVGDCTCAVCLSEFEDGEDLRTMPECAHSFHVPCIDMWLRSHPNCPVCRTDATPSPQPFGRISAGGEPDNIYGTLESIVVQSRYSNTAIS